MVQIGIRQVRIRFEWLEFAFCCFECHSNGSTLHSNASNLVQMVRIGIGMVRIPFDGKNLHSNGSNLVQMQILTIRWLESLLNGWNLHSNASNLIQMVRNCNVMLQTSFERFELALEFLSNGENLHLNG